MRGDFHENGPTVQRDSSSGSSSPHSNTSHDDDVVEVNSAEFIPKPIYNFSIPDVIIHERENRRQLDRGSRRQCSEVEEQRMHSCRKRPHPSRNNFSGNGETPVNTHIKRRRRAQAAAHQTEDDEDCHRESVVIDLTDIDSHDEEYQSAHSDSEVNNTNRSETRPLRHFNHGVARGSFRDCLSNLQRFHQRLQQSNGYRSQYRDSALPSLNRLRRRRTPIITDGPVVTVTDLLHSPEIIDASTPEQTTADDSVTFVNEVRNDNRRADSGDHHIALRMLHDPTYSPPYHSPPSLRHSARELQADESFREFQERVRAFRLRNRERFEQARRISIEAHQRLARIQESLSDLQRLQTTEAGNTTRTSRADTRLTRTSRESSSQDRNEERNDELLDNDTSTNEVEFVREWNPPGIGIVNLNNIIGREPLRASFGATNDAANRNTLPDIFMDTLLGSSIDPIPTEPRLHHLQNYEALLHLADRLGPAKTRGLTKTELDLVPSFRFSKETSKATNTKCVICMSEYANREKLRRLPCTHDFHAKCIDKWLKSNITCPICRDEVNPSKENELNDTKV